MSEQSKQSAILKHLRELPNSWWVKPTVTNMAGCPDIIGCLAGQFYAFEVKNKPTDKPSPIQVYQIDKLQKTGARVAVVRSWLDAKTFIDSFSS